MDDPDDLEYEYLHDLWEDPPGFDIRKIFAQVVVAVLVGFLFGGVTYWIQMSALGMTPQQTPDTMLPMAIGALGSLVIAFYYVADRFAD